MPSGYSPHHVDWVTLAILLQHKDTGTFRVIRIILNYNGLRYSRNDDSYRDAIRSHFIVPVAGYDYLPSANQFANRLKIRAHNWTFILISSIRQLLFFSIPVQ